MTDLSNWSQKPIESYLDEVAKGAADGMKTKILLELDHQYTRYKSQRDELSAECLFQSASNKQFGMDALHELKRRILELE